MPVTLIQAFWGGLGCWVVLCAYGGADGLKGRLWLVMGGLSFTPFSHFSVFSEKVESGFIYQKQAEIHAGQMGWTSNLSAWASKTFTTLDK
ncbi:MAG: hypothetical protein Q3971_02950 [Moraxella sp.]|nr:hypothetical protein [Moraxella sp.]